MKPGMALWGECRLAGMGVQGFCRGAPLSQIKKEDTLVLMLCRCLPRAWVFDFMQFGLHYPRPGFRSRLMAQD